MYAVMIEHPLPPGMLTEDPERVVAASRPWQAFLASQPGFKEYLVLADRGADAIVAMTVWEREEDFHAALAHPQSATAAASLLALFVAPTAPRGFAVLAHQSAP